MKVDFIEPADDFGTVLIKRMERKAAGVIAPSSNTEANAAQVPPVEAPPRPSLEEPSAYDETLEVAARQIREAKVELALHTLASKVARGRK